MNVGTGDANAHIQRGTGDVIFQGRVIGHVGPGDEDRPSTAFRCELGVPGSTWPPHTEAYGATRREATRDALAVIGDPPPEFGAAARTPAPDGRFRRPSAGWCTDTAIRVLKIATREPDRYPSLLEHGEADTLLAAAAILDRYGQRIGGTDDDDTDTPRAPAATDADSGPAG